VIISIHLANVDDAESLTAIQTQAFERLYQIYQDEGNPYLRGSNEMKYQIENSTLDIYKIFADGSLCGGMSIRNNGNGEYYLHRIYVLPHLQGKGIAGKSIELCEKNYPDAKRWKVDFPIDQLANKKCYENCGYCDTGLRDTLTDKLTLAFYEKVVCGIYEIHLTQIHIVAEVIRASFETVATEFGLTEQNCPNHTSFITTDKLHNHIESGWLMYGLYENGRLVGYISLSNKNEGVYELHNLAVLPDYRHKGYGKQILDFCKTRVKELGGSKITIGIIEEHTVLKNWYAANGFVHTGIKTFAHLPFTVGFMEWEEKKFFIKTERRIVHVTNYPPLRCLQLHASRFFTVRSGIGSPLCRIALTLARIFSTLCVSSLSVLYSRVSAFFSSILAVSCFFQSLIGGSSFGSNRSCNTPRRYFSAASNNASPVRLAS